MTDASRHDAWTAGDAYEAYMGRWSRKVAPSFLRWLGAGQGLDWLEVGCGTGALSRAILDAAAPRHLVAIDASEGFVATARDAVSDGRVEFRIGDAQALGLDAASRDVAVSGLVLNFVPDRRRALMEMRRVLRPGGLVGFYVWDYPGGGLEFLRAFWREATALDPGAVALAEDRRFPFCTREGLMALASEAGLSPLACEAIEVDTVFQDFADYWRPFTMGAGPAPGYCASLSPAARDALRERLEAALSPQAGGAIAMRARAWALKAAAG